MGNDLGKEKKKTERVPGRCRKTQHFTWGWVVLNEKIIFEQILESSKKIGK